MDLSGIITFLSDFGTQDWFVAAVKGEILKINKHAVIIDVCHTLPPHDIKSTAFILFNAFKSYPAGTVHLSIVDPGVGSDRRAILVEAHDHIFIAPDNGVLSYILDHEACVYEIPIPENASTTFQGRDVFALAAAYRSLDQPNTYKTIASSGCVQFPFPEISITTERIEGEIVYIDYFGNMITNIPISYLIKLLRVDHATIPIACNYAEGKKDMLIAVKGSSGFYEVAMNRGNAQEKCQGYIGKKVIGAR